MTSDRDIVEWVEDNYEPEEESPTTFVSEKEFRGKREKIAKKAAEKIYRESNKDQINVGRIVEPINGKIRARSLKTGRFVKLTARLKELGRRLFGKR